VEDALEDGGGGDAVDVVVAVDDDGFAGAGGFQDAFGGTVEVVEARGILEGAEGGIAEFAGGVGVEASREQHAPDEGVAVDGGRGRWGDRGGRRAAPCARRSDPSERQTSHGQDDTGISDVPGAESLIERGQDFAPAPAPATLGRPAQRTR